MSISLITPTCNRQAAIENCERWIARQTIKFDEWIVADGGDSPVTLTMGQTHLHNPQPQGAQNLTANILAALERVSSDIVIIIEDDDWYRADHIERCIEGLNSAPVYGCNWLNYYHVRDRRWVEMRNRGAALCQTAFYRAEINRMRQAAREAHKQGSYTIDGRFWAGIESYATGVQTVVGIKGFYSSGLGVGHRSHSRMKWQSDPRYKTLYEWIGDDAQYYL